MDEDGLFKTTQCESSSRVTRRAAVAGLGSFLGACMFSSRHAETGAQEVTPVPLQGEFRTDYREDPQQQNEFDAYWIPHEGLAPAVILIHGGAMAFGKRFDLDKLARSVAEAGYVAFNIDYRLLSYDGMNQWPTQLDDVQLLVRWIRANAATYGVDAERIGALGHSAGGLLAAFLGTRETRDNSESTLAAYSSRVSCVVDLAGDVDLTIPLLDAD